MNQLKNAGIHQITKLEKSLLYTTDERKRQDIQNKIDGYKKIFYKNEAPIANAETYIEELFSKDNIEIKNAAYDYIHNSIGSDNYSRTASGAGGIDLSNYRGAESEIDGEQGQSTRQTVINPMTGISQYIAKPGNRNGLIHPYKK